MIILLFIVHVFVALALVCVVMLQKSEGGALGMGGGGGMSGFMTGRSTSNLLTRITAILAAVFMLTSILLVVLSNVGRTPQSIIQDVPAGPAIPTGSGTAPPAPGAPPSPPAAPAEPSAPLAK